MRAIPVVVGAVTHITGKGIFTGASVTAAAVTATLLAYDGVAVTAAILADLTATAGITLATPGALVVPFSDGLHVVLAGAGGTGVVYVD